MILEAGSGLPHAPLRMALGEALLTLKAQAVTFAVPSLGKDAAGNALNSTALSDSFTPGVALDTVAPTLSASWPTTEGASPGFARPTATQIALTFGEDMKAGAQGGLTLVGKHGSGNLSFAASSLPLLGKRTF